MDEELMKVKYRQLKNQLTEIKEELELLKDDYNDLNGTIKETLLIDDKIVEEDLFISISNDTDKVLNELTNVVIPIINSKI